MSAVESWSVKSDGSVYVVFRSGHHLIYSAGSTVAMHLRSKYPDDCAWSMRCYQILERTIRR